MYIYIECSQTPIRKHKNKTSKKLVSISPHPVPPQSCMVLVAECLAPRWAGHNSAPPQIFNWSGLIFNSQMATLPPLAQCLLCEQAGLTGSADFHFCDAVLHFTLEVFTPMGPLLNCTVAGLKMSLPVGPPVRANIGSNVTQETAHQGANYVCHEPLPTHIESDPPCQQ